MSTFRKNCKILSCVGEVFPPPGGMEKYFALGSNVTLQWTYNDNASTVRFRSWHFTSSDGSEEKVIAEIDIGNKPPDILNSDLPRVRIEKPATLVLENVNLKYDGTYRFQLAAARGGGGSKSVTVIITGTF
jgi:hypothetical protein